MSEEINETLDNNESMEMSEVESTIEVSHTYTNMNSAEFEKALTDFFTKNKKTKLHLVPRIVNNFKGNESEVMAHLHNKYVLGITSSGKSKKKGVKKISAGAGNGHDAGHDGGHGAPEAIEAGEAKPKSKKKMVIIIIILVVVLGGGGAAAFMFKDKLFGGGHGAEHGAAAGGHGEAKAEGAHDAHGAAEQPKEETAAVADSAAAPATDSAKTEAAAPAEHAAGGEGH